MSAPVPLSAGCCSPPCPSNPQTAVPGPAGENAFSLTTAPFTQPAVNANVVISLSHDGWIVPGQTIFIQGGGYYVVVSVSGLNATITNNGNSGNSAPGVIINNPAQVSPGGIGGNIGNAYTTTTAGFTQPAVGAQVNVSVLASAWAVVGEPIFIAVGGSYTVFSVPDGTHIQVTNLGYPANAAPAAVIPSPQGVTPSGVRGATGASGVSTLNGISPTTTKGDLIVDNGSNSPLASDVRMGVGTDGKVLAADSAQPTGLNYVTTAPNTVATSGDIAIYNGTSGKPTPLQDSKMLITADGALQSTPSGGNARGSKAIDLQVDRALATQVASGNDATIAGGKNNTASGNNSTVAGGTGNTAAGTSSVVAGGNTNAANGTNCGVCAGANNTTSLAQDFVGGGQLNTASGGSSCVCAGGANTANAANAFIGGGSNNTVSGGNGAIPGGSGNTVSGVNAAIPGGFSATANLYGEISHGSFNFAATGDAQTNELTWGIATVDATAGVEMFLDGTAATQRAVVGLNNTWAFHVHLAGRSSAGVCAVWETKGGIQNVAGTVTLIAANTQVVLVDGTGGTWGVTANFAITADNVNKSLKLAVTGAVATNIRWVAHARLVQVNF